MRLAVRIWTYGSVVRSVIWISLEGRLKRREPVTWIEKPVEKVGLIDVLVDVTAHKGGLNRVPGFSDLQRWNGQH